MASQQATTKPFQKILDPTKMGSWNVVRRPPIDKHTVVQGKPREQNSNAFREHQFREGVRLRKALNALTHGKNIFVYHNIRTNQVVYSLTRYLEKNNVLRQLLFHGKKTIPSTLRKDMWVPYYSVHFNSPRLGLRAYHLLREFSAQRQLAPPREMITIDDVWLAQKRPRDPLDAREFDEKYEGKKGWLMEKKHRARAVMDQKATSVADVAAVLAIQEEEIKAGYGDGKERGFLTRAARKRRREARAKEAAIVEEAAARRTNFQDTISNNVVDYKVEDMSGSDKVLQENGVKILWTDWHDAEFAQEWPARVVHSELDLSRDHIMPGEKRMDIPGVDVLANSEFKEKKQPEQTQQQTQPPA